MCNFASAVLTKDHVFLGKTNSHSEIIDQHGLHECGVKGVNVLNVELVPDDLSDPISKWRFRIDQDILPEWVDKERDEKRAREAIEKSGLAGVEREYRAKHKVLGDEYEAKLKPLWDEYDAKLKPLWDEYYNKHKMLGDEYAAKFKLLQDEYYTKREKISERVY